jgi:hypothetical protein
MIVRNVLGNRAPLYTLGRPVSARLNPEDGFTVRVSENARRAVVFFGAPSPKTGDIEFGGTGFLVAYREDNFGFGYLVTARHVAKRITPDLGVVARVNDKEGASVPFTIDEIFWAYHPDPSVDVAVTTCSISVQDYDVTYLDISEHVNPGRDSFRVVCGDPISIIGLFHLHPGSSRNTPIVHSGNIALLPDPRECIPVKDRASNAILKMEAYLVEAQTLEGLSGAPVLHREMVALRTFPEHNGGPVIAATGAQLLGVYSGAWEGEPSPAITSDRKWGPDRRIPVGMGIVVPATRIWEVIMNDPELKKRRDLTHQQRLAARAAVTDSAFPDPQSDDVEPNHRERFTALLGAAARKQTQDDQT